MSIEKEAKAKFTTREQVQIMIAEQKRRNRLSGWILVGYFIIVLLLSYLIPENVLVSNTSLDAIVNWAESWIPSVKKFGEVSAFPQVAQLVFMLEILTIPILLVLLLKTIGPSRTITISQWMGVLLVVFIFVYGYFFYIPGDGQGYGASSRVLRSMAYSKFFFALWTSVGACVWAWFAGAIWKHFSNAK